MTPGSRKRHIILVGLSGSGKTTVGRAVAEALGTTCLDLDQRIADREGRSIVEIFARDGEASFRRLERAAMAEALADPPQVVATGGGWAAEPGAYEQAAGALVVYLRVSAEAAATRLRGDRGRPLLDAVEPVETLREMLRAREAVYAAAGQEVETTARTVEEVAAAIVRLARRAGGW